MDKYLEEEEGREALKKFAKTDAQPANPFFSADKNMESIAQGVGCTACVALMADNKIIVANAGDSRAVVCQKGKDIALSKDHKPDDDVEKRRIQAAGGFVEENRVKGILNLSRSLGDLEYKTSENSKNPEDYMITPVPEFQEHTVDADTEFLIVACDGIWDCLTNLEACTTV